MADDDDDDSGGRSPRKRVTTSPEGADTIDVRVRVIELRHAEMYGADGGGGQWRTTQKLLKEYKAEMDEVKATVDRLNEFRIRALATFAVYGTIGTAIAGVIVGLVVHFVGK